MKAKKILFLVLALLFPVLIFLFLKLFGENEFQVAILHQDGHVSAPAGCDFSYSTPYQVADTVMAQLGVNEADSLYVLFFDHDLQPAANRVLHAFADDPVHVVALSQKLEDSDAHFIRKCALLMDENISVALVDQKRRIRGYYDGGDRDDVDRLIVEVKIILKQY